MSRTAVAAARQDRFARLLTLTRCRRAAGLLAFAAIGVPAWARGLNHLMTADRTVALREATVWLDRHAADDDVIVVDDSLWVDLVERGHPPNNVIWFYKVDLDPAVELPGGWQAIDYVVLIESGPATDGLPTLSTATGHSQIARSFGSGPDRLTVRRVSP